MTTPRAALHVAGEPNAAASGEISDLARDPDPLRRLEAELQRVGDDRTDGERLHEQAWSLLEEAWGLVTECLVLRDGLLDACREIEQTMEGIQSRLAEMDAAGGGSPAGRLTAAAESLASGSNGAGESLAGGPNGAGHT